MVYTAILKNPRTVTENGVEKVLYYYRIPTLKGDALEQYKADKGQYYLEDDETGQALFIVSKKALGPIIEITRSRKPNALGVHSWYAKRTIMQVLNDVAEQYPALAKSGEAGMQMLHQMAKDIHGCESISAEEVTADPSKALDSL